jgi:hypothetical protein
LDPVAAAVQSSRKRQQSRSMELQHLQMSSLTIQQVLTPVGSHACTVSDPVQADCDRSFCSRPAAQPAAAACCSKAYMLKPLHMQCFLTGPNLATHLYSALCVGWSLRLKDCFRLRLRVPGGLVRELWKWELVVGRGLISRSGVNTRQVSKRHEVCRTCCTYPQRTRLSWSHTALVILLRQHALGKAASGPVAVIP